MRLSVAQERYADELIATARMISRELDELDAPARMVA